MPGFRHSPLDDISRIRQDLRDRYQDGFPILKELLQNTDDAGASEPNGAATQLMLVLAKGGLPGGVHPLLQTAGFAVLNDGAFTASDSISLTSLGMSNKAGQAGAAGKFGLGLKSIFHWAEAFFYFSPHVFGEGDASWASPCDLLNPWWSRETAEGRHRDWEEAWRQSHACDLEAFSRLARQALDGERWFGLWIPLRCPNHLRDGGQEVKPIEQRFPLAALDELLGHDWRCRLLETLPLLRRLRTVQVVELDGRSFKDRARFCVGADAQRMRFGVGHMPNDAHYRRSLTGIVQSETSPTTVCRFAGIEQVNGLRLLQEIKRLPRWPNQTAIGPDGADLQVSEKAEPHGAVVFSRQPADGQGVLRAQHVVFLPLGEPETIPCGDAWRYTLNLHGFAFVDSGRRHLQSFEALPHDLAPHQAETEMQVVQLWNRTLLRDVVGPMVLPSLSAFVKHESMAAAEIEWLLIAMRKSKTVTALLQWMCRGQRFVYRLQPAGGGWMHETWDSGAGQPRRWLELPKPDFAETELFELVPALAELCTQAVVSTKGKPYLSNNKPNHLSDDELAALLKSVPASGFETGARLAYLLELIPDDAANREPGSDLAAALVRLANQLTTHALPEKKELAGLWKEFFKRIPTGTVIRLPIKSSEPDEHVKAVLGGCGLPVALLWEDWSDAAGKGQIPWAELAPVLERLGCLPLTDEKAISERATIVARLLEAATDAPRSWPSAIARLPLFTCRAASGQNAATSFDTLRQADEEGRLFISGDFWAKDLAKAAPELKPLLVERPVVEVLSLSKANCDGRSCVRLLQSAKRLAPDFASRKPLFERLLAQAKPTEGEIWKALRCLLHGQMGEWDNQATLFGEAPEPEAFVKLAQLVLVAANQSWRSIAHDIRSKIALDAAQRWSLRLHDVSAASVEALVNEIGPKNIDCTSLTTEESDTILLQFDDVEELRGLNIHETSNNRRVRIGSHTYVDDASFTELPEAFSQLVTRIRNRAGYARGCFLAEDGSNRLVKNLDWEAVIEIAIAQQNAVTWWETLLTAIGRLGSPRAELCERVREVAWLPLATGGAASPADLLHLSGADEALDRLPAEVLNGKIPILRLAQPVRNHARFSAFVHAVLPPAKETLDAVVDLLKPHPAWSTGLSGEWSAEKVADWIDALGEAPTQVLPVAALVKALHGRNELRDMLPGFLQSNGGRLGGPAYAEVLKHLAQRHVGVTAEKRVPFERVVTRYLGGVASQGRDALIAFLKTDGMRLLSRAGSWKSPGLLAFPCDDLRDEDTISGALTEVLISLRPDRRTLVIQPAGHQRLDDATFDQLAVQTWDTLRRYFAPWAEFIPQEMLGAFIATLGSSPAVIAMARHFLGPRSIEEIRTDLDDCAEAGEHGRFVDQVTHYTIACVEHSSKQADVLSLLGNRFPTALRGSPKTIFFGDGVEIQLIRLGEYCRHTLHLRLLDLNTRTPDQLADLLEQSAVVVLSKVYDLREIELRPLWKRLQQISQLHIRIAQNRVVDAAQAFLRQVGAHQVAEVQAVLEDWNTADRRRAEAEEAGRRVPEAILHQLSKAKQGLRDLLGGHPDTQQAILARVQRKIRQDYGYESTSVPFEVWQNADDAVVELAFLGRDQNSAEVLGFVVDTDAAGVAFAHWGRMVNEFQGADGAHVPDRHFDADLERMVVQAISDKRAADEPGGAVTGKFGLGFKSVFLVSDAPEVVSGSVDFVIRGGIYPLRLESPQREALVDQLKRIAPDDWRRGTLIRLPFRAEAGAKLSGLLVPFQRLAPLLVIFSRKLKRLRLWWEGKPERGASWQPQPLATGIQVGQLPNLDPQVSCALVFEGTTVNDRLQLVLALGPDGCVALPSDVPLFWVTAPTRSMPDYGFAVNGPFEPDVGRGQLALNSSRNGKVADELARVLAERLRTFWHQAQQDWNDLRDKLRLASASTALAFWESLWEVLGRRFAEKCPKSDSSPVAALARLILWHSEHTGLRRFYSGCAALPTGLWGEHQILTRLPDIRFEATGALDREHMFHVTSQWRVFRERVQPAQMVSGSRVASVLRRLGALSTPSQELHLATVVEWELSQGGEFRADPETAGRIGGLITQEFLKALREGKPEEREERELRALNELLPEVQFQASDGSWRKSGELVVAEGDGVEKDEQMRAGFAPPEAQLHPGYTSPALAFFLACRSELGAGSQLLSNWMLETQADSGRIAAVTYLLQGRLKEQTAESLRNHRDDNNWLWQLADRPANFAWFGRSFTEDELHQLRAYVLRIFDQELRDKSPLRSLSPPTPPPPPPHPTWTVQQLWLWWERQGKPTNDYVLEGESNWRLFGAWNPDWQTLSRNHRKHALQGALRDTLSPAGKAVWYRLFGYACLVSAGRRVSEMRDFWTQRLDAEQFWTRTIAGDFSQQTREVFERAVTNTFTNINAEGEHAHFWRRVFYDIRKMHRMIDNDFPSLILGLVDQGRGAELPRLLRSGHLDGIDQPRIVGTFGQSSDTPLGFIIRELFRLGVITDEAVRPYAFYVCRPVLRALTKIGWISDWDGWFSGIEWIRKLERDPECGPMLLPYSDIPLLHMGITHRGDKMPSLPNDP